MDLLLYLLGKSPNILINRYCRNFICIAAGKIYCLCNGTAIYNILLNSPVRVSAYKRKNCVEANAERSPGFLRPYRSSVRMSN